MIYLAVFVCIGPLFLLLAGERISARLQAASDARTERERLARLNARIAAERDLGRRTALRMIRDNELEQL